MFLIFSLIDVYLNTACTIFLLICHSRLLSVLLLLQHSSIIHEVFSIPSHVTLGADLTTSSFEWSFIGRIGFWVTILLMSLRVEVSPSVHLKLELCGF